MMLKKISFIGLLFFSNISCANQLTLPKPTGSFSVGTKAIEIRDPSRRMFRDENPRRWMVQAFYPTEIHEDVYPYMPETLEDGIVQGVKVLSHAKPNADPLKSRKYPVILFIPGLGGERQKYTILCEDLASHGYVVLSVDEPYVSNFVKFPDGTKIVLALNDVWKLTMRSDRDYRYQYYDDAMDAVIKDVIYMMDSLVKLDANELGGICDTEHLILMGHSFGGNVSHTLGFRDNRVKAVVDIDSKITERDIFGHIGVPENLTGTPVLFIRGMMQYQEDLGDQLTKIKNATIWSPNVQHSAFSDSAYFAAKIENFGTQGVFAQLFNWFFKRGSFWDRVDTKLGEKNVDEWYREYRTYIVNWLNFGIPASTYRAQA